MKLLTGSKSKWVLGVLCMIAVSACATTSSDRNIASTGKCSESNSESCSDSDKKALDESYRYSTFHQNIQGASR